jgi:hypothetical protein
LSGHGKKQTDRGPLTNLRQQREGVVRTWEEINRPGHTHFLETAERIGLCQDMEENKPTEAHSLPGDSRERDLSGHGRNLTGLGALTNWRQ